MFRKILNLVVAASVAVSGFATTANAQTYMFRYKVPTSVGDVVAPPEDVEYGVGNDIVAYYVAPVGYDFSKRIPVATQDVVDWRKDSGDIPGGIGVDTAKGVLSGEPAAEEKVEALFHGYDRAGNRIARAEIHFTTFEAVGEPVEVDFYTHVGTYFYGEIPSPQNTSVARWEPIVPFATGMSMMGQALQGIPEEDGNWGVAWRGFDYLDREVAFAYGDLLVENGPMVEEFIAGDFRRDFGDQTADKSAGDTFSIQAAVRNSLGTVTYRLVPVNARPAGLSFSSTTGTLSGVFADYDTSAQFQIEARDSYDGTIGLSDIFTLTTLPQEVSLASAGNLYGYAGTPFFRKFSTPGLVATAEWALISGTLPDGLTLDKKTGVISGTPSKKMTTTDIVIGVSGAGMIATQSPTFTFTVYPEYVTRETTALHVRTNAPFSTDGVTVGGALTAYTISAAGDLPGGGSIDSATGVIRSTTGITTPGVYDAKLIVDNGNKFDTWQAIRVYNPLEISYASTEVKRYRWMSIYPTLNADSTIGSNSYTIRDVDGDALPAWMSFDASNGRISGEPGDISTKDVTYGPYIVTRADAKDTKDSLPFTIKVLDRDPVDLTVDQPGVERFINIGYLIARAKDAIGEATITMTTVPSNWPSTLSLNSRGWLIGKTTDPVGTTYAGIVIKAVDEEGYEDTFGPFDLTVVQPKALSPLAGTLDRTVEWTAGMPYSGNLPTLSNGFGTISYGIPNPSAGLNLTDATSGAYSFTAPAEGTFASAYTISDETDRAAAQGTLTLQINPPLSLAADTTITLNRAALFGQAIPAITGGTKPFTYVQTGALPKGIQFLNGSFFGTPEVEGQFPVSVVVTDKSGMSKTSSFTLDVGKPLPLELKYPAGALTVGQFKVVWPQVKNSIGALTYELTTPIDQNGQKIMPPGLSFDRNGRFIGTPSDAGVFGPYSVKVTDSDTVPRNGNSGDFSVVVTRTGEIDFTDVQANVRKGAPISVLLSATNIVPPINYSVSSASALPTGVILAGTNGTISGSLADDLPVTFAVTVTDRMLRQKTANVTLTPVGDMTASAAGVTLKQYETSTVASSITTTNTLGAPTFALSAGALPAGLSVDPASGAIIGTSDVSGTWPISVQVTDTDGQKQTVTFTVTVDPREPLVVDAPASLSLKRFSAASFAATVTDAIPPVQYAVTPDLPTGIILDTATGAISGSSDDIIASTVYTLTATDSKGGQLGTDTTQFTLQVEERDALAVTMGNVDGKRYVAVPAATATPQNAIGSVTYAVSPDLPTGLTLDTATGTITGTSDVTIPSQQFTLTATDVKGGTFGTATATFALAVAERDPLQVTMANVEGKRHGDVVPVTAAPISAIGPVTYSVAPALPTGFSLDPSTGTVSGKSEVLLPASTYTLTATDEKGGPLGTATTTFTLAVGERDQIEFVTESSQQVLLDEPYSLALSVKNVIGSTITWSSTGGTLPEGLAFDPATGTISGTAENYDEKTNFVVKAEDGFGGSSVLTIAFAVGIAPGDLTITAVGGTTRVNEPFSIAAPTATDTVGTVTWSLSAPGTGLTINTATGEITGTPTAVVDTDAAISVKDVTGRRGATTVRVKALPRIELAVANPLSTTFNYTVDPLLQAVATNVIGTAAWSISGPALPNGMGLDPTSGALTGKSLEIGSFGPYTITVADDLPGTTSKSFTIQTAMNDDPIELAVTDFETKIGYPVQTALPTYENNLGPVTFFSTDLGGTGLALDTVTGVLTGTAQTLTDTFLNVSVKDRDTTRVTSRPLRYKVIPPMQIVLPSQVIISALENITPVAPTRNNVVGAATWEELDQSVNKLPEGIVWDTATGTLKGNALEIGTFGPFTVASTDSVGDRGISNSFVVKSNPGAFFLGIKAATLADAVKRTESYSYDFSPLVTTVGMDLSEVIWSGTNLPPGLTLANGVLSGTPALSGAFNFSVTVSHGNIAATRAYSLVVNLPQTELELATANLGEAKRAITGQDKSFTVDLKPNTTVDNIPLERVVYTLEPLQAISQTETEAFPAGLTLNADGTITGTASSAGGTYQFRVRANFKDATDEDYSAIQTYTLTVKDEISFEFGTGVFANASKRLAYSFDLGSLLDPAKLEGVTASQLSWSWAIDPVNAVAPNMTTLPVGLSISGSTVSGTPTNSGTYAVVVTASFDGRSKSKAFTLQSNLQTISLVLNAATLSEGKTDLAYSIDFKGAATIQNLPVSQVRWTSSSDVALQPDETAGLPPGLELNPLNGVLSGTPVVKGAYRFKVTAVWENNDTVAERAEATREYAITIAGLAYKQVEVGNAHTCALTTTGAVKCWGANNYNQLSASATGLTDSTTPVTVEGLGTVKQISAGQDRTCALQTNGEVLCWGIHFTGSGYNSTKPAPFSIAIGAAKVAAGRTHTCIIGNDTRLYCQGSNNYGQIGNGSTSFANNFVQVSNVGTGVKDVSVGDRNTCAITSAGAVMCWGDNATTTPTLVTGMTSGWASLDVGGYNRACALSEAGSVSCWKPGSAPSALSGFTGITQISGDGYNSANTFCGVRTTGATVCNGTVGFGNGPTSGAVSVSTHQYHACAVTSDGGLKCWGRNTNGQLGNGSRNDSSTPVIAGG